MVSIMTASASKSEAIDQKMPPDVQKTVIEQIAKEIQHGGDIITSLRTRSAFTIWVGPYIVLGSIVVAVKGGFTFNREEPLFWIALGGAVICYLVLGYIAGRIERHTLTRSNNLRRCIESMAKTGELDMKLYLDEVLPQMIVKSYWTAFGVLLLCFFGVAIVASKIEPRSAGSDSAAPAKSTAQASVTPAPSDQRLAPVTSRP
jgi:hypothetical protein